MLVVDDPDVRIHLGDALEQLRLMPSESVHCIVTSPPFWGLRDYGTASWRGGDPECDHLGPPMRTKANLANSVTSTRGGANHVDREPVPGDCPKCGATRVDQQIGLEDTLAEWVAALVAVFTELKRVLRHDATFWLEIGDTYVDKQLSGAPWRLAFALQEAGWFLRSDCIWARPNPMPESVRDRPTKAHSYVFLLTKSARYFYDADAIREDAQYGYSNTTGDRWRGTGDAARPVRPGGCSVAPGDGTSGRNARSVWTIPTQPTPWAHFATFPEALVERCVKAGTSEHGACSECGAPWRRITERPERPTVARGVVRVPDQHGSRLVGQAYQDWLDANPVQTTGWEPSCSCFPEELARRCIAAGTSEHGACSECGAPWRRITLTQPDEREFEREQSAKASSARRGDGSRLTSGTGHRTINGTTPSYRPPIITENGWRPTCACVPEETSRPETVPVRGLPGAAPVGGRSGSGDLPEMPRVAGVAAALTSDPCRDGQGYIEPPPAVPCVVLDPFMGSGTTALVARRLGRHAIGIELNAEYAAIAAERLSQLSLLA